MHPKKFIVGATIQFTLNCSNYSAGDGWVVAYAYVKAGNKIEIATSDDGSGGHLANVNTVDSGDWVSGVYRYQAMAKKGGESYLVDQGVVEVVAGFSSVTTAGLDARSHAEKMVDALQKLLEGKAGEDLQSMSHNGRSLTTFAPGEWRTLLSRYEDIVRRERLEQKLGRKIGNKIQVRFSR